MSRCFNIPKQEFEQLVHGNVAVGRQFVRLLAGQVGEREQLLGMAYGSIRRRVADALLRLQAQAGPDSKATIQCSREHLAAVVGTAPESLIRTLSEFKQTGLIELASHSIRVVQPDKLRQSNW